RAIMKTKTLALAALALLAAGQARGEAAETPSIAAQLFAPTAQKSTLSKQNLVGFWKGSLENNSGNLNAFSAQYEIHFGADGKFESRQLTASPSIYDDSLILRKDQVKGSWKVKGDSLVLRVESCLIGNAGPLVETCEYLAEMDSVETFKAGFPSALSQEKQAAQFVLPSLAAGKIAAAKDRSWALALGESSKVYPEPALEAGAQA